MMTPSATMLSRVFLNFVMVLYRYLPSGTLDWENGVPCMNVVGARHVAYCVKGAREHSLQRNNVLGFHCGGFSCLSQPGVGVIGGWCP